MKNEETKNSSTLTDFDICELFIKCNEVVLTTCSKLDIEKKEALKIAKELWKETLETLKEYRKDNR